MKNGEKQLRKWIKYFCLSIVAAVIVVGVQSVISRDKATNAVQKADEAAFTNEQIIEAIIYNCEHNNNPLRKVVQSILRSEIAQSSNRDLIEAFAPKIPPAKLDRLITREVRKDRRRLKKIAPLDCSSQYSPTK